MEKEQKTEEEQKTKKLEGILEKWFGRALLGGVIWIVGSCAYYCNKEAIERLYEESIQNLKAVKRHTKNGAEYLSIPFNEKEIRLFYYNGEYLSTNRLNEIYQKRAESVLLEKIK